MSSARTLQAKDGTTFRDLNHNGTMEPYEDPRLPVAERVNDLVARLSLPEKAGLLFHTVIEAGSDGSILEHPGNVSKSATSQVVLDKYINHFNVHALTDVAAAARWSNAVQQLAAQSPHGIPVTISTDPRHGFSQNLGASFRAGIFSAWPEPLGLAAIGNAVLVEEFADIARQEYVAVGLRAALHPCVDLATEPRWARQSGTFGQDPRLATTLGLAYLRGFQRVRLGADSVACTAKHFPGGGPQTDGEDAHFPYGREQDYRGGAFAEHLEPFPPLVTAGVSGVMPYYGMPINLVVDGEPIREVGFGFNKQIVTEMLREQLGFTGVVLSDWELINDNWVGDQVLPARAWGVENLDPAGRMELLLQAGIDQFGGEECVEVLLELVATGRVAEGRIDESARRLLAVKFELGLFDDPFVDEQAASAIVGNEAFRAKGLAAQSASVTLLHNGSAGSTGISVLPLAAAATVYSEGVDPEALVAAGFQVSVDPAAADVALVRLDAPWQQRSDLFLESYFHQGSLDFPPGLVVRMQRLAAVLPLIIEVTLDRPAILTPLLPISSALVGTYGCGDTPLLAALTGAEPPRGRLPFDLPRSMADVREKPADSIGFADPLFAYGHGLDLPS